MDTDSTSTVEHVALRISCISNAVQVWFRTEAERDRWLHCEAVLVDQTIVVQKAKTNINPAQDGWSDLRSGSRAAYPHAVALCAELKRCPRFGIVELEGYVDQFDQTLCIPLPDLHKLPWPRTQGAIAAKEHQRAAAERLAWGQATGLFRTRLAAASYLREQAPEAAKEHLRPVWGALLSGLDLPDR